MQMKPLKGKPGNKPVSVHVEFEYCLDGELEFQNFVYAEKAGRRRTLEYS
jgi:hypothetical protein